jgi:hypothetical protein
MKNNESKIIYTSIIVLLILLSGFGGYSLGKNDNQNTENEVVNVDNSAVDELLDDVVVLTKNITPTDGGGATLTGSARNKSDSAVDVTLAGIFKTVDGSELVSVAQTISLGAKATESYSIDFGADEIREFASFDVVVVEVTRQ